MFLTRCDINPARRGAQKLLGSPQAMHATVLAAFPESLDETRGRVLWRVDTDQHHVRCYIVSHDRPDLTHLIEQAGWPTTQTWETREYGRLLSSLTPGQRWGFRLHANPTRSTRIGAASRSQRVGHVTADQQLGWFLERAAKWGIEVPEVDGAPAVRVRSRGTDTFRRENARVTLATATYEGLLDVSQPDLLARALTQGIGPAKAYGCGLLTLAPVPVPS